MRKTIKESKGFNHSTKNILWFLGLLQILKIEINVSASIVSENPSFMNAISPNPKTNIEDVTCNVNDLEKANDSQLHTILHELRQTAFFRMFAVDLDESCPVSFDGKEKIKSKHESKKEETTVDNEIGCASDGLPDSDPDSEPACGIMNDQGNSFQSMFSTTNLFGTSTYESESQQHTSEDLDDDDDEYVCEGNKEELDEDAPPLCTIDESNDNDYFSTNTEPFVHLSSSLTSISESKTWESESQKQTFSWSKPSDPVIMEESSTMDNSGDCNDAVLSDTFWMDMCSQISSSEKTTKFVNLILNPERNTGYNGTHIWNAIYEENCLNVDGSLTEPLCYEERVLYRLLSGLHTSTTLSIAKNYYPPSKRKNRTEWESNPTYFWDKFNDRKDQIDNLYFSYVVLLRALRKSYSFLYHYTINTGDILADEKATILLRRLLDTHILRSCTSVFDAFDESLMFQESNVQVFGSLHGEEVLSLKQNFKEVFHNISSILDCVQCQQCKLHGKMAMLGYGSALKILFLPPELINEQSITRNEIVAFINTIAKFSDATKEIRELTHLYWTTVEDESKPTLSNSKSIDTDVYKRKNDALDLTDATIDQVLSNSDSEMIHIVNTAVGNIAYLARNQHITIHEESELVTMAFQKHPFLMILTKHYGHDRLQFLHHLPNIINTPSKQQNNINEEQPDAIIVGSGLAGLAAAINILDRNGTVTLIDKEHRIGGNSAKASSGINACCPHNSTYGDLLPRFRNDTIKSAGNNARLDLIETLVTRSESAVNWLKDRIGVDLSLLAQLGGHQHKRTHRPKNGMAGAEIIYGMQKALKKFEKMGKAQVIMDAKVTELITNNDGSVIGVKYVNNVLDKNDNIDKELSLYSPNVVLATGGFAADRSSGSYLSQFRPEYMKMAATAGDFSTGDGISLATNLGAGTVDMDKVQIHPTGWVDPSDRNNTSKVLAAELMRGVGGILLNKEGKRFCNELGTRAYVTDMMLQHDSFYQRNRKWNENRDVPIFSLILSSSAAEDGKKHVDLYTHKGLLTKIHGIDSLAHWMQVDVDILRNTMKEYQSNAKMNTDEWGKSSFRGVPSENLDDEIFYAGSVTPVLHYCMGGITIDTNGNVLNEKKEIIPGLHAAGEVTGGVHGDNRLGGNSLLECTVYGTIIGQKIPIQKKEDKVQKEEVVMMKKKSSENLITIEDLKNHNSPEDCWVAIHGVVYDLTDFAEEHPPGAESIHILAGTDGTEAFQAVHNKGMLDDFEDVRKGLLLLQDDHE